MLSSRAKPGARVRRYVQHRTGARRVLSRPSVCVSAAKGQIEEGGGRCQDDTCADQEAPSACRRCADLARAKLLSVQAATDPFSCASYCHNDRPAPERQPSRSEHVPQDAPDLTAGVAAAEERYCSL
ncbi:hypothetical protein AGIG_G5300 [Arapaima gigas]